MDKQIPYILVVDDDPNMTGTVGDILKLKGFEPVTALSGRDALRMLEDHHIEVALIDLRLGKYPGLMCCARSKPARLKQNASC